MVTEVIDLERVKIDTVFYKSFSLIELCLDLEHLRHLYQWRIQDFPKGGRRPRRGGAKVRHGDVVEN